MHYINTMYNTTYLFYTENLPKKGQRYDKVHKYLRETFTTFK